MKKLFDIFLVQYDWKKAFLLDTLLNLPDKIKEKRGLFKNGYELVLETGFAFLVDRI